MHRLILRLSIFMCILFFLCAFFGHAQLQFCGGNSGDPIFTETFGTGTVPGPELPLGTTSYTFTTGAPNDGFYTVSNNSDFYGWFGDVDHTPNDINGKYFIVNASHTAGEFYRQTITDICENTSYEFSAWLINLLPSPGPCSSNGIPINVRFQIWDASDTILLASGDTGDIFSTSTSIWEQHGLVFKTQPGQNSVILKLINNGTGGCGNDLAIDDIVFKTCGDLVDLIDNQHEASYTYCENDPPTSYSLTAQPDFTVFNSHFYQWQMSTDKVNWMDIPGETSNSYTTPPINTSQYYRVKVAEDPINLSNTNCIVFSNLFEIVYVPVPSATIADDTIVFCEGQLGSISAQVPADVTVDWYDAPSGGNLLAANSPSYMPGSTGVYYAEARSIFAPCVSANRAKIEVTVIASAYRESVNLCAGSTLMLSADTSNASYLWSTGETTEAIAIQEPGTYTVTVTHTSGCTSIKTVLVTMVATPTIESIVSQDENIEVTASGAEFLEYSLDGIFFRENPIFEIVEAGFHTIYVRGNTGCTAISQGFLHIIFPKFFTPNGDGHHDTFRPEGVELGNTYELSIFDRFGVLILSSADPYYTWDGRFNGADITPSDYWYVVKVDDMIRKGHFALKR